MIFCKKIFVIFIIFSLISCGKNKENEEHELEQQKEPHYKQNTNPTPELQKNDITFESPEDSVKAVKHSILRKQNFKKKVQAEKSEDNPIETTVTTNNPAVKKAKAPSFVYIKKILNECEIGKTMTQKDLQSQFNIPKEAIQLVKTVTKIPDNELDVKRKTTWLVKKMSDAKFKNGRLKVRFEKTEYTHQAVPLASNTKKKHTLICTS